MNKLLRFLASLKLAVIVIAAITVLVAVGTFVEAKYDSTAAQKLVYKTIWMYVIMGLLATNLIAVMITRWPWQKRHIPFILAHIGILVLLVGSVITLQWGIDGNVRLPVNGTNTHISTSETELTVYASFDGQRYSPLFSREVDFFVNNPKKNPIEIPLFQFDQGEKIRIVDYFPYTLPSKKIQAVDDPKAGPAVRFQITSSRVNMNDWLWIRKAGESVTQNLGPAQLHFGQAPAADAGKKGVNEIYLETVPTGGFKYSIIYKDASRKMRTGFAKEFDRIETGWMDIQFQILRYYPHADEIWDFQILSTPTPLTTPAVKYERHAVDEKGKLNVSEHWAQLNDVTKFFTPNGMYVMVYGNRRIPMGEPTINLGGSPGLNTKVPDFVLRLKKFTVGRYQGTMRAASYQSEVEILDPKTSSVKSTHLISMNEPLKHAGLTFYQASFQDGPDGQPVASVLSVNYDPGRWLKYLGSLIMSLGVVWLFVNKRKVARATAPKTQEEVF